MKISNANSHQKVSSGLHIHIIQFWLGCATNLFLHIYSLLKEVKNGMPLPNGMHLILDFLLLSNSYLLSKKRLLIHLSINLQLYQKNEVSFLSPV
jgi:predicted solute-binding protein